MVAEHAAEVRQVAEAPGQRDVGDGPRVRSLYGMVEDATLRSTRARVARRLLLLARGDATQARELRAVVPVSQEALAMMLGVSRQTLSKELQGLAREGAIELGYGRIAIASVGKLEAFEVDH